MKSDVLRIGIVAGEPSGDLLGAELIKALRNRVPEIVVEGIGGPEMQQAGCLIRYPMQMLSVMGLVEVMGKYLKLSGIRRRLAEYFINNPPDVFIGIDSPDFNLGLEKRLHRHGIRTVHYVSPQVWAWREYRLRKMAGSIDLMLSLFPFEEAYYRDRGIKAACVGHPLAGSIPMQADTAGARQRLGLPVQKKIIAIMPGSRNMELARLAEPFLLAADMCRQAGGNIHFISSLLDDTALAAVRNTIRLLSLGDLPITLYTGRSHEVLEAADIALLASGTITLEAMLYKKPMVVAYKLNPVTYTILKALAKVRHVALPNILAGEPLVPECLQEKCTPERLSAELLNWIADTDRARSLEQRFARMHGELRMDTANKASGLILELAGVS